MCTEHLIKFGFENWPTISIPTAPWPLSRSCEFDYCSPRVDQRRELPTATCGCYGRQNPPAGPERSWSTTRHILRRRWPMAESIYSLPECDQWHDPYSASFGVGRRQNLCFASLWGLTGNDLQYPRDRYRDSLWSALDTADQWQIHRASTSNADRPVREHE